MKPGFTTGNTHLGKGVWTWTLPAGITCPGAFLCKAWTDESGCLKRGGGSKFCCYAARAERFPNVRLKARLNYDLVRNGAREEIADIIHLLIPLKAKKIRIHAGGDFFSLDYTLAWFDVCERNPNIRFWAFTKSIHLIDEARCRKLGIPSNLKITQSLGGRYDHIRVHGVHTSQVFLTRKEAEESGLPIDTDDSLPMLGECDFALIENSVK